MAQGAYRYCPYCATPLVQQAPAGHKLGERRLPACPACGFVQYPDPKVGVVAAVEHGDRLLLVRRAIHPGKGQWSLPGGYMNAGELPQAAVRREVAEEVGLTVRVEELLAIHPMVNQTGQHDTGQHDTGSSRGFVMVYRAVIENAPAEAEPPLTAGDDAAEARWFTADDLPGDLAFASTVEEVRRWADNEHSKGF